MTDPKDFYKNIIADPETDVFMKTVYDRAKGYGENKDQFLNFLMGSIVAMYDSMEMMIANLESVKLLMLLKSIEHGMMVVQDVQRESDIDEGIKPV